MSKPRVVDIERVIFDSFYLTLNKTNVRKLYRNRWVTATHWFDRCHTTKSRSDSEGLQETLQELSLKTPYGSSDLRPSRVPLQPLYD